MSWSTPHALICALTTALTRVPCGTWLFGLLRGSEATQECPVGDSPAGHHGVAWVIDLQSSRPSCATLLSLIPCMPPPSIGACRQLTHYGLRWIQQPGFAVPHAAGRMCNEAHLSSVSMGHVHHLPVFAAYFPLSIIPVPWLNPSSMHKLSLHLAAL